MKKYGVLISVLFFVFTLMYWGYAHADGDRIEPSVPIAQQLSQSMQDCKQQCLVDFAGQIDWSAMSVTSAPPDLYNKAFNRRWRCEVACE